MIDSTIIAIIGVVLSLSTFYIGRRTSAHGEGKESGIVMERLGSIKEGIDDIKAAQREQAKVNIEIYTRLSAVEASANQAHNRLDQLTSQASRISRSE